MLTATAVVTGLVWCYRICYFEVRASLTTLFARREFRTPWLCATIVRPPSGMPTVIVRSLPVKTAHDDHGAAETVTAPPDGIEVSMPDLRVATSARKPSRRPLTSPRTYQCIAICVILLLLVGVASVGAVVAVQARGREHEFRLVRLANTRCLDGSPAVYYIAENASSSSWVVWLEGGGICRTQDDCEQRAKGSLGSSTKYPATMAAPREMLSSDPELNPDLHTWNRAFARS